MKKIDKTNLSNISGGCRWVPAIGAEKQRKADNRTYYLDEEAVKKLLNAGFNVSLSQTTFNAGEFSEDLAPYDVYDEAGNLIGDDRMRNLLGNPLKV